MTQRGKKETKGERTREHILTTALRLFEERGYAATTLREIAGEAQCSLGLAYRYFGSKEQIVLALYERLADDLAREVNELQNGPLAERFTAALRIDIARLKPYRAAIGALFGATFSPESEVSLLGAGASAARQQVQTAFAAVAAGASDSLSPRLRFDLGKLLYAAHLLTVLYWLQDRTPNQQATEGLIAFAGATLGRLRLLLRLPGIAPLIGELSAHITRVTEPDAAAG